METVFQCEPLRDRLIIHYLRQTMAIFSVDGPAELRRRLFFSYTRLFCRYILAVKFSLKKTARIRVDGYSFPPTDFGVLRHLYEEIFIERIYDLGLELERPKIVDCGSNIGMSVLFFKAQYPQAQIVAFEPDPDNFQHLQSTVSLNFSDVTIHNKAVSDTPGRMNLYTSADSQGGITTKSLYRERLEDTALVSKTVEVVRLSDYLQSPVDLLKIDVEGAETAVIHDLIVTGGISHVKNMIIEFHDIQQEGRPTLSRFLMLLEQQGFILRLAVEPLRSHGHIDLKVARDVLVYASRAYEGLQG
jgi:FkbM family methyltransferase